MRLWSSFAANWKASSENQKASSEDAEGFFPRALALCVPTFQKNGAVPLADLPEFCLGLLQLQFGDVFVTETGTNNGKVSKSWHQV